MKKPDSLRQILTDAIEYFNNTPDALNMSVNEGSIVSTGVTPACWEFSYILKVDIAQFADDPNLIIALICDWLSTQQPDALNNKTLREKLFRFEGDILRSRSGSLTFYLPLTERVIVTQSAETKTIIAVSEPEQPAEFWLDKSRP